MGGRSQGIKRCARPGGAKMISITDAYIIVDGQDEMWLESLAPSRRKAWQRLGNVCAVPKAELIERGFKSVRVTLRTEEYKRERKR